MSHKEKTMHNVNMQNEWAKSFEQARHHWRIVVVGLCAAGWAGMILPMIGAWITNHP